MACKNCGNTKCNKLDCGCKDSYLTTPAPCPTPEDCPEAQPCAYVTNSFCVEYRGDDITCNNEVVIETGDRLETVVQKIVDYFCNCIELDFSCLDDSGEILPQPPGENPDPTCLTPREAFTLVNNAICDINNLLSGFSFDWTCLKFAPYLPGGYGPFTLVQAFEHLNTVICDVWVNLQGSISDVSDELDALTSAISSFIQLQTPTFLNLPIYPDAGVMGLWTDQGDTGTIVYDYTSSPVYTVPAPTTWNGKYEIHINANAIFYLGDTAAAITVGVNGVSVGQFTLITGQPIAALTSYTPMHLFATDINLVTGDVVQIGISSTVPNDITRFKVFGGKVKIQRIGN